MKLSDKIVQKYNRYFKEMLEYYKLSDMRVYRDLFNGLEVCNISELATITGTILPDNRNETRIAFIKRNYPGLTPFYKLYLTYYNRSFSETACRIYLKQINECIKTIREDKESNDPFQFLDADFKLHSLATTNPCGEIQLNEELVKFFEVNG